MSDSDGQNGRCPCGMDAPLLSGFVDGQLSDEERARVETHVAECDRCRSELEAFRVLHRRLREAGAPEVSDAEWSRVWSGVAAGLPARPRVRRRRFVVRRLARPRPLLAAAALVLLLVGAALLVWHRRSPSADQILVAEAGELRVQSIAYDSGGYTLVVMSPGDQAPVIWLTPFEE